MPRAARWAIALPLVAALVLLSSVAWRKSEASLAIEPAAREMASWAASGSQPAADTWGWIRDEIARVARADPGNATAQELLGALAAVRADSAEATAESTEALRKALALRPVSPYTWAGYAEALYRQGDTGGAFAASLERAVALGPAEPGVQRLVALYGLAVYDEVNVGTQRAVDRAVAAGLRRDPAGIMTIARRRGRLDVACRLLPAEAARAPAARAGACEEMEATP